MPTTRRNIKMTDHSNNMINSVHCGDISQFKIEFEHAISELLTDKISASKESLMKKVNEDESEDEALEMEKDAQLLDPAMSKEYFLKKIEHNGHEIVLKKVGLGPTKPVSVHINGERWEVFPGPKVAEKESKNYVETIKDKDTSKIDTSDDKQSSESEKV